jgi:hypothetical protein
MALWVHHCSWCDWSRNAESPTILAPYCDDCGGLLEAVPADASVDAAERSRFRTAAPHLSPAFGRLMRFTAIAVLLFAAGRFGWGAGGFGLGLAAVGVVGLFTVPLIVGE